MNVVFFGFKRNGLAFIDAEQAAALKSVEVQANDVLLNITGASIGRVTLAPPDLQGARVNQHVCIIRPTAVLEPRYLRAFLSSPEMQAEITAENYGVTRQALTKEQILGFQIPLAPLAEQKRIADKLDALLARLDACRDHLDRVPAIIERFRQAVLAVASGGELTREWRDENGRREEWRETTVGALVSDVRYGTSKKCFREPRKTPVLRIPNVVDGAISHSDMKYAEFDEAERAKLALVPGDVLMIRSNGSLGLVGRTAVVSAKESGFLYAGYLIRLRPDQTKVRSAYLSLFLAGPASRARIEQTARSTTGVNNINTDEIRGFPIVIPRLDEQDEVVRRVGELFEIAARLERRLADTQARVEGLMPSVLAKAFQGDLVPKDPNDEPASLALSRVQVPAESSDNAAKPKAGGVRRPRTTPKGDATMLVRKDVAPTHLTAILKERGPLTAESLWAASQLDIDDFYDQLKEEEANGLLRETRGRSPSAQRMLEPAA